MMTTMVRIRVGSNILQEENKDTLFLSHSHKSNIADQTNPKKCESPDKMSTQDLRAVKKSTYFTIMLLNAFVCASSAIWQQKKNYMALYTYRAKMKNYLQLRTHMW